MSTEDPAREIERLRAQLEELERTAEERRARMAAENGRLSREVRLLRAKLDQVERSKAWRVIRAVRRLRARTAGSGQPAVRQDGTDASRSTRETS